MQEKPFFISTAALALALGMSCAHSMPNLRADDPALGWPQYATPTAMRIPGGAYQAVRVAAQDFVPHDSGAHGPPSRDECLLAQAAYDYEVIHDEAKQRYFVHVSPGKYCNQPTQDLGAEYAIDSKTWTIEAKRGEGEVSRYRPSLAALVLTECPACRTPERWFQLGMTGSGGLIERTLYVTNVGEQPASAVVDGRSLGDGFGFKGGTYPGTGGTCGGTLPGGETCTVVLTYEPQLADPRSTFSLNYFDGSSHRRVAHGVFAIPSDKATLAITDWRGSDRGSEPEEPPYHYPAAGVPVDHTFHVRNIGVQPATALADGGSLSNGFGFKGGNYPGTGGTCGAVLAPGESCTLVVNFTPGGAGKHSSALTLDYHDGAGGREASRRLTGTATLRAALSIADFGAPGGCGDACGPFHFGTAELGSLRSHTFTVINTGAIGTTHLLDDGILSAPFAYAGGAFPGVGGTCGDKLAAGASCTVVVQFTPTTAGTRMSSLTLTYADGQGSTLQASRAILGVGQ